MIFIRHPETENNKTRRFPEKGSPYTDYGKLQFSQILTRNLQGSIIYSSPYDRCLKLAQALSKKLEVPLVVDQRLKEIDCGLFSGMTFEEIENKYPHLIQEWMEANKTFTYPEGESLGDVDARAKEVFFELPDDAIVVSHQAVLFALGKLLNDAKPFETGEIRKYDR